MQSAWLHFVVGFELNRQKCDKLNVSFLKRTKPITGGKLHACWVSWMILFTQTEGIAGVYHHAGIKLVHSYNDVPVVPSASAAEQLLYSGAFFSARQLFSFTDSWSDVIVTDTLDQQQHPEHCACVAFMTTVSFHRTTVYYATMQQVWHAVQQYNDWAHSQVHRNHACNRQCMRSLLQVSLRWAGDANIAIAIELPAGGEATRMVPKISDLHIQAIGRVLLAPLVGEIPGFGAAVIALRWSLLLCWLTLPGLAQ